MFQRSKTGLRTGRGPLKLEKGFDLIIIHGIRNNMLEVSVFQKSWVAKTLYSASESLCQANVEPCCRRKRISRIMRKKQRGEKEDTITVVYDSARCH